ncbi:MULTISPECIES: carbohydrate kinase [unclassified Mucilaginibacter]|uniref:carbohydrate kinase family protein n=1 Tax=unclassified Mucilaginibacter TaxID=2617802 RepID=UPI00138B65A2|nr:MULTISPECIES: carbohydrate kinase [unclassified Mucilaginibacter]MBB5397925.1 fructokinase [Mucilaginibacter sp. AK015]QHS55733.1 carbohydrate kinase [Mucilaginibacter sp. 14171R-50]
MKNRVLCFGEVLWDAFGDEKKAGGAPMNVARHLVQQHIDVKFASRVGSDASGDELVDFLKNNGLYSDLIQRDNALPTCEVTVELDAKSQATYIIPQPVSWDNIHLDNNLKDAAKRSSTIVFGSLACREKTTHDTLLNLLDETDAIKIFDVNLRHPHYTLETIETLAARADVIKMNEEEADLLIGGSNGDLKGKITEFRNKYHTKTICVTRGENGAIIWHDYEFFEHPGFSVDVADTVGAGDAFLATFIAGIMANNPIPRLLLNACAIGAFVTSQRGANPVYNQDEISRIRKS